MIGLVLGSHSHQHVDQAYTAADDDVRSIGAVVAQRVGDAFELGPVDRFTVKAQQSSDSTHGWPPVRSLYAAERGDLRESTGFFASDDFLFRQPRSMREPRIRRRRAPPRGRACSQCHAAAALHARLKRAADKARPSGVRADIIDRPGDPVCFIGCEAANMPGRAIGPCE